MRTLSVMFVLCYFFQVNSFGQAIQVADIRPGEVGAWPSGLIVFNDQLYFAANDGFTGSELWTYDGENVTLVSDINPGTEGSEPYGFCIYNGKLYFSATNGQTGYELWSFDGNSTLLEADIYTGNASNSSNPEYLTEFDGKLYFKAFGIGVGHELWSYDGNNVVLEADINPGTGISATSSTPSHLCVYDNKLFFRAWDGQFGNHGYELWSFDGSLATLEADIWPGNQGSYPGELFVHNGLLYFEAESDVEGFKLWSFDGTDAVLQADFNIWERMLSFNGDLYFSSFIDNTACSTLWRFDGSQATQTTSLCMAIFSAVEYNSKLYFPANDSTNGWEIWSYDGVQAIMETNDFPQVSYSAPGGLRVFEDKLYFAAADDSSGINYELWSFEDPALSASNQIPEISPKVYPNPVTNKFYVSYKGNLKGKSISIYSIDGKLIEEKNYAQTIDVSNLSEGIYIVKALFQDGTEAFERIVIQ